MSFVKVVLDAIVLLDQVKDALVRSWVWDEVAVQRNKVVALELIEEEVPDPVVWVLQQ